MARTKEVNDPETVAAAAKEQEKALKHSRKGLKPTKNKICHVGLYINGKKQKKATPANTGNGKKNGKKKKHWRPGTVALREIRKYQK